MSLDHFPESPKRDLTLHEQNVIHMADTLFRAIAQPERELDPLTPIPSSQPVAQLKFLPKDVFEMVIAGTQLAFFVISSDLQTCSVCGHSGANMSEPEGHHPCCKVRRWWNAVDALKIGLEVR